MTARTNLGPRSFGVGIVLAAIAMAGIGAQVKAAGAASTPTPTVTPLPRSIVFSGRVTNVITGTAVAGASLCLSSGFCAQSDLNGLYAGLCYPGWSSAGTYLCAQAVGYQHACQGPWTPTGGSRQVDFALVPLATPTPTSCVSDPPLVNAVMSPTEQLVQTLTGYSPGLFVRPRWVHRNRRCASALTGAELRAGHLRGNGRVATRPDEQPHCVSAAWSMRQWWLYSGRDRTHVARADRDANAYGDPDVYAHLESAAPRGACHRVPQSGA